MFRQEVKVQEVLKANTLQERLKFFIPNNIADIREIAEGLGYSPYTVKNWLRDPRSLKSTATVIRVAQYLEVDIGLLLDGISIGETLTCVNNIFPIEILWQVSGTNEFRKRIHILQDYLEMSNKDFRNLTTYSNSWIKRIYKINYPPHIESLCRIANALYAPPSLLLRGIAYVDFYDNLYDEL